MNTEASQSVLVLAFAVWGQERVPVMQVEGRQVTTSMSHIHVKIVGM